MNKRLVGEGDGRAGREGDEMGVKMESSQSSEEEEV